MSISAKLFFHPDYRPAKPYSKTDALRWLELTQPNGAISVSLRTMSEEWGWSMRATKTFIDGLIRIGALGNTSDTQAQQNGRQLEGRNPRILHISESQAERIPDDSRNTPPAIQTPTAPLKGGPTGSSVVVVKDSRAPGRLVGDLGLQDTEAIAFQGEHVVVTEREMRQLERAYPKMNVLQVCRQADKAFRLRAKGATPAEWLERCLSFRARENATAVQEREESIDTGGPLAAATGGRFKGELPPVGREPSIGFFVDQRLWWRQYGIEYLKRGEWSTSNYGPKPWEPKTRCPAGLLAADETENLRRKFDAINQERTSRERNRGAGSGGQPQSQMPKVQPSP